MSKDSKDQDDRDSDVSRRTFLEATGAALVVTRREPVTRPGAAAPAPIAWR